MASFTGYYWRWTVCQSSWLWHCVLLG